MVTKTSPKRRVRKTSPKRRVRKTSPKRRVRKTSPKRRVRKTSPKRRVRMTSPKRKMYMSGRGMSGRGMSGRGMSGRGMGDRGMGDRGMGDRGMGDRGMEEPEVMVLRPSSSDLREAKHIMRKQNKINKRAQIFVQYFHRCLTSLIEKNTDRHAADAMGGIRINHISNHEAAYECGFDEKDFEDVLNYIYVRFEDTYCRGSKFWYKWDWAGLNRARGSFV